MVTKGNFHIQRHLEVWEWNLSGEFYHFLENSLLGDPLPAEGREGRSHGKGDLPPLILLVTESCLQKKRGKIPEPHEPKLICWRREVYIGLWKKRCRNSQKGMKEKPISSFHEEVPELRSTPFPLKKSPVCGSCDLINYELGQIFWFMPTPNPHLFTLTGPSLPQGDNSEACPFVKQISFTSALLQITGTCPGPTTLLTSVLDILLSVFLHVVSHLHLIYTELCRRWHQGSQCHTFLRYDKLFGLPIGQIAL